MSPVDEAGLACQEKSHNGLVRPGPVVMWIMKLIFYVLNMHTRILANWAIPDKRAGPGSCN